jgi:hypothetical protein
MCYQLFNFLMISRTEYTFLSQQSAMSVCKRAGFLSPNRISELVCDRESEEVGHRMTGSFIYAIEFNAFLDNR